MSEKLFCASLPYENVLNNTDLTVSSKVLDFKIKNVSLC